MILKFISIDNQILFSLKTEQDWFLNMQLINLTLLTSYLTFN